MTLRDPGLDTPLQAWPSPLPEPALPAAPPRPPGPLSAAAAGARFALSAWRPLLAVVLVQLLLALTVAVPFQVGLSSKLGAHPHAAALAGRPSEADTALGWEAGMDGGLWNDAKRELGSLYEALPVALFWVLVVAWLFGAVAAGGFLGLAGEAGPRGVGRFFLHGGRWFGRMARVGLVFALVFFVVARVVYEGWGKAVEAKELEAASQGAGWWGSRAREVVLLLAFFVLRVVGDLARADLVLSERRSAFLAFFRRFGTVLRHPVRTLATAALVGIPAFGLLYVVALLLPAAPEPGWRGLLGLFLAMQVAVLLRWMGRAALLAADVRLLGR